MQDRRSSSGCLRAFAHLLKTHIAHKYAHNCASPEGSMFTKSLKSNHNMDVAAPERTPILRRLEVATASAS